jgi:hypothetical protein
MEEKTSFAEEFGVNVYLFVAFLVLSIIAAMLFLRFAGYTQSFWSFLSVVYVLVVAIALCVVIIVMFVKQKIDWGMLTLFFLPIILNLASILLKFVGYQKIGALVFNYRFWIWIGLNLILLSVSVIKDEIEFHKQKNPY